MASHKFSVIFTFWIATLALLARNDGQRKRTLSFENDGGFCHFERSEKSKEFKIHFLNLWILRYAQYDKDFVGMTKFISMTNKKFLWWAWVFWADFGGVYGNLWSLWHKFG